MEDASKRSFLTKVASNKGTLDSKFTTDRWTDNPSKDNFRYVDDVHADNEDTECS